MTFQISSHMDPDGFRVGGECWKKTQMLKKSETTGFNMVVLIVNKSIIPYECIKSCPFRPCDREKAFQSKAP